MQPKWTITDPARNIDQEKWLRDRRQDLAKNLHRYAQYQRNIADAEKTAKAAERKQLKSTRDVVRAAPAELGPGRAK